MINQSAPHLRRCLILLVTVCPHAAAADEDARTHIEQGRLQGSEGAYEDAQASYLEGISLLTEELGETSPVLVEPYAELAQIYILNNQPLEAITVLQATRDIMQRTTGLFGLEQVPLLDEIGRAHLLMGNTLEAQNIQRERLNLALRQFGDDDPQTIPFRNYLADYYDQSRMRLAAREEYEAVADLLRDNFGDDDGSLLDPLSNMTSIDILLGDARAARRQLERVLASSTNATSLQRGNALAVLGDYELSRRRTEPALEHYREAYAALRTDQLAEEYFGAPRFVNFVAPLSRVDWRSNPDAYAWGSISARFSVSADGQAMGIVITESHPSGLMDAQYANRLNEARFRPRFVDGEPVATALVSYRHEFRYLVAE